MSARTASSELLHLAWVGLKFGIVGVASVLVYFGVLLALRPVVPNTVVLTAVSYIVSAVFNYALQSTYTFRTTAGAASVLRYLVMHGICMTVNSGLMLAAVDLYGVSFVPAQVLVTTVVAGLSFVLSYLWVYAPGGVFQRRAQDQSLPMKGSYLPQLDGLRFVAFLAVFVHHLPAPPATLPLGFLHQRGWIGVDLFFVISALLFFRLFEEEVRLTGRIDVLRFYLRRLLRLYPLMIAFPVIIMLATGNLSLPALGQLIGIATFVENFAVWYRGYQTAIAHTAHLWTLSFEFQIYAVIPLAFIIYQQAGRETFVKLLLAFWIAAAAARFAFLQLGAPYTIVWVTPFFRPETILVGIAISLGFVVRAGVGAMILCAGAAVAALALMPPLPEGRWAMLVYPTTALLSGALVCLCLHWNPVRNALSQPVLVYLGKISFGLYVFHFVTINTLSPFFSHRSDALAYSVLFALSLLFTVAAAAASYHGFERYFLRLKLRATVVQSRPV